MALQTTLIIEPSHDFDNLNERLTEVLALVYSRYIGVGL